jgi:hypothetical protein
MAKNRSSVKRKLTSEQRATRRNQVFFFIVTGVVLISMILSLVK